MCTELTAFHSSSHLAKTQQKPEPYKHERQREKKNILILFIPPSKKNKTNTISITHTYIYFLLYIKFLDHRLCGQRMQQIKKKIFAAILFLIQKMIQ